MREAYSHEVISHGFWPGGGPVPEAAFYAYAVPEPLGFRNAHGSAGRGVLPRRSWASSSCRTRRSANRRRPTTACLHSSKAPMRLERPWVAGIARSSSDRTGGYAEVNRTGLRLAVLLSLIALFAACGGAPLRRRRRPSAQRACRRPRVATSRSSSTSCRRTQSIGRRSTGPTFRQVVVGVDSNERTIADLYPKVRAALSLLNDHHSFYQGPDCTAISSPSLPGCTDPAPPAVPVPDDIGYVKVGSFSGRGEVETEFAQGIQDAVRAADRGRPGRVDRRPAQQWRRKHVAHGCRRRADPR